MSTTTSANVPRRRSRLRESFCRSRRLPVNPGRLQNTNTPRPVAEDKGSTPIAPEQGSRVQLQHGSCPGLGQKYQPKAFEEMIGNGMIIKALHNAVQSRRVSPLYLFHGPGGSGKTSAAKVFASALNCESASHPKPCWVCRSCSMSQSSSFESAKTLLQSTTSDQRFPGFKVFIIDECQKLPDDSWGQLLDIIEQDKHGLLVFIVVVGNVSDIPRAVSSRCLKFSFTRLKDTDIAQKLAKIVVGEGIQITDDALELIARSVEGNLREAENLVDRLALLGQTITISIVQQLVGLVPHEKLFRFLEALLRGDSIEVARSTKDLIVYCIKPQDLMLQLASLLTDILSGASSSPTTTSQTETSAEDSTMLKNTNPERLYRALRNRIYIERQLRTPSSSNNATWVTAAMLQITSDGSFNNDPTNMLHNRLEGMFNQS